MAEQCSNDSTTWSAFHTTVYYSTYYGLLPSYLSVGTLANVFLLAAFVRRSKKEGAFGYQAMLSVAKIFEFILFGITVFGYRRALGIVSPPGVEPLEWFVKSYCIMFIYFYIAVPMGVMSMVISLLVTISLVADRVFALYKPFVYKNINHRRHKLVAGLLCVAVGVVTGLHDCWQAVLIPVPAPNDNTTIVYYTTTFSQFSDSSLYRILSVFRLYLRLAALFALVFLNAFMLHLYKKRTNAVASMTAAQRMDLKKAAQKSLIRLTASQSVLMCVNQIPIMILWTLFTLQVRWVLCYDKFIFPFADIAIFTSEIVNVFVLAAVDKKIRSFAAKILPLARCKCADDSSV